MGNRAFCGKHLTASAGPVSKPGPRVFSFPLSLCPCPLGPSFPWPLKEERSLCFNLFFDGCTWTNIIPIMLNRDTLNFFDPNPDIPAHHENQLTRAFLVVLRMSPAAHQEWLSLEPVINFVRLFSLG